MRIRLTIVCTAQRPTSRDVLVRAPEGSRLADIRDQLASAVGVRGRLYIGAATLSGETRLGVPPLVDGAIVTVGQPGPDSTPSSLLQLRVVGGPDAGHIVDLRPGSLTIGRSNSAAVPLNDPDVSRTHAALDVTPDAVVVRDLGSTNGTTVDGRALDSAIRTLRMGELLRVGMSSLILDVSQQLPAAASPDGSGGIRIGPAVRQHNSEPPPEIGLPVRPVPHQRSQLSLMTALVPLVLAAGLLITMRDPAMLWFLVLSPVAVIVHWAADRIARNRSDRRSMREYTTEHSAAISRLSDAIRAERTTRRQAAPDPAAILSIASGPLRRIWERRPTDEDFLEVRVGTGRLPSRVKLVPSARATTENARQSQPMVEDVPVCVNLRRAGVVGVAGPPQQQRALLRSVIGQLATLHSPEDLELIICSESSQTWSWTAWLPHTSALMSSTDEDGLAPLVELKDQLAGRRPARYEPGRSPEWDGRTTVLILDEAHHWLRTPQLSGLSRDDSVPGLIVICVATEAALLPASCATTVVLDPAFGPILEIQTQGQPALDKVVADLTGAWWAEQLAHRLAPLRLPTSKDARIALPSSTRLLQLMGLDPPTPARLVEAWSSPLDFRVVLGVTSNGLFEIDLVRDGPHILVAGTTGAGKSELLQTLVAGLAIQNRPDRLTFLLVDYKGGAAFAECRSLPHVVGLVTDLDSALTERALRSLTAELRRRERILESTGSRDLEELQQRRAGSDEPTVPPRLVIVVDEFATLSEELPEFVAGLVGIAQRGRSLGIHLVLATQRPAGVVRADIKANTTLRIALRMTDAAESLDVIDISDAAMLPRQPGRAIARVGSATPVTFQTARISCPARVAGTADVDVRPLPDCWSPSQHDDADTQQTTQTDLEMLASVAQDAAANLGIRRQLSPWHVPLPDSLSISDIPCEVHGRPTTALPLGLTDYPDEQRQPPFDIDVAKGAHLVVAGGARSGRSTVLHTLAGQVIRCLAPSELHLYAIDNGDSLRALSAAPQCGAVVRRHETSRGTRLLGRLLEEVDRRRELLSAGGFTSVEEQRQFTGGECPPWLLLLIDGWEAFLEDYEDIDYGTAVDDLLRLLREGPSAGVTVVITGGRAVLTGRVSSVAARRLILRLPDRHDYGYAGVNPRRVPSHQPPGRGLLIDGADPVETQIALLSSNPDGRAQSAALATLLEQAPAITAEPASPAIAPIRVAPLPTTVPFGALLREHIDGADTSGSLWAPLGIGGDEGRLLGVDLDAIGPGVLVAGPRRSGRSSVLLTFAKWYAAATETTVVVVAGRGSPLVAEATMTGAGQGFLDQARSVVHFQTAHETSLLGDLMAGAEPLVVLVDDGDRLAEAPVDPLLTELLRSGRPHTAVVIAGTTEDLASGYRGAVAEARRSRAGILLCPSGPLDGEIFRVRTARCERRPGRGLLVVDGVATPLQVADPRRTGRQDRVLSSVRTTRSATEIVARS